MFCLHLCAATNVTSFNCVKQSWSLYICLTSPYAASSAVGILREINFMNFTLLTFVSSLYLRLHGWYRCEIYSTSNSMIVDENSWHHVLGQLTGVYSTRRREGYSKPNQTSKMYLMAKTFNGFLPLTIFAKSSILDVWLGSECASGVTKYQF